MFPMKIYVIQKHRTFGKKKRANVRLESGRLHYDLRLEMNGVLKSWAVPKTPPTEKGVRRLAVQVEDHPIGYANFEGTIPAGQYGAGTVEIWDKGHYVLKEKDEDKLVFEIRGNKLGGDYCLVRFKGRKNWLFFKKK